MLKAAMVFLIVAGIFGLPAAACSAACAGVGSMAGAAQDPMAAGGQSIMEALKWLSLLAAFGSIIVGALVKQLGKVVSGCAALAFAVIFLLLLVQGNVFGVVSSVLLVIGGIMVFVAPNDQFRSAPRA